jgi:hypothetical protein
MIRAACNAAPKFVTIASYSKELVRIFHAGFEAVLPGKARKYWAHAM